jgi:hypothetical protein
MSFGQFLLYSLWVMIWVGVIVAWVFALVDLFGRHDLSGWAKAAWLVAILIFPLLGVLVYFFTRPEYARGAGDTRTDRYAPATPAEQLRMLAELRDSGKITDAEFQAEKARLLGQAPGQAPGTAVPNP